MSERIPSSLTEPQGDKQIPLADMPEKRIEADEITGLESQREVFEQLYRLVKQLDPEGTTPYTNLRDKSRELTKITNAMANTLRDGGAVARADELVEYIVDSIHQFDSPDQFAEHLIDRTALPEGDDLEFNTHYRAGLSVEHEADQRTAA